MMTKRQVIQNYHMEYNMKRSPRKVGQKRGMSTQNWAQVRGSQMEMAGRSSALGEVPELERIIDLNFREMASRSQCAEREPEEMFRLPQF